MNLVRNIGIFLLMLIAVGACTPQSKDSSASMPSDQAASSASSKTLISATNDSSADLTKNQIKEFKMTARQFSFEPDVIEVNKGDKVRLVVTSVDVPHGISIPDYGINRRLNPAAPVTIDFIADKQGTFTAYCSVACGPGHGSMKGRIIVK